MSVPTGVRSGIDVVAIGASAGGVEALSTLLPALPANAGLSVFVVLHLPRQRQSLKLDIFAHLCALELREAQDKEPVLPNTVYFAPPDYHMLLDPGPRLALSVDDPVAFSRPSIDVLFESAADQYGTRLLGIILTGANEDGAAGLLAVRRAGGLTLVQDPTTAQVATMPAAALRRSPTELVLPLPQIAEVLRTLRAATPFTNVVLKDRR